MAVCNCAKGQDVRHQVEFEFLPVPPGCLEIPPVVVESNFIDTQMFWSCSEAIPGIHISFPTWKTKKETNVHDFCGGKASHLKRQTDRRRAIWLSRILKMPNISFCSFHLLQIDCWMFPFDRSFLTSIIMTMASCHYSNIITVHCAAKHICKVQRVCWLMYVMWLSLFDHGNLANVITLHNSVRSTLLAL